MSDTMTKPETESEKPAHILLARDELRVVLQTLQAQSILGLPEPEMTPEQLAIANQVAQRTLRARRLAQMRDDGTLLVHMVLLTAVGVAAYPEKSISALCWDTPGSSLKQLYAHQRGGDFAIHTKPEADIHRLTLLNNQEKWLDYLLEFTDLLATPTETTPHEVVLEQTVFATMQEMAYTSSANQAVNYLSNFDVPEADARALAETFNQEPRIVILQIITLADGADTAVKYDLSLVQGEELTWLIVPAPAVESNQPLVIKTCTLPEVETLLKQWLA